MKNTDVEVCCQHNHKSERKRSHLCVALVTRLSQLSLSVQTKSHTAFMKPLYSAYRAGNIYPQCNLIQTRTSRYFSNNAHYKKSAPQPLQWNYPNPGRVWTVTISSATLHQWKTFQQSKRLYFHRLWGLTVCFITLSHSRSSVDFLIAMCPEYLQSCTSFQMHDITLQPPREPVQ